MILEYFTTNVDNSARNDICFHAFGDRRFFDEKSRIVP